MTTITTGLVASHVWASFSEVVVKHLTNNKKDMENIYWGSIFQ